MITRGVFKRIFRVAFQKNVGTCFAIEYQGKQYLITVAHLLRGVDTNAELSIWRNKGWEPLPIRVVGIDEKRDVAVLAAEKQLCAAHGVIVGSRHLTVSQDIYFLGFPYGLYSDDVNTEEGPTDGFPLSLVKKGIVSAFTLGRDGEDFLIDGHNNPGFSGGPMVFERTGLIRKQIPGAVIKYHWRIGGIIRGYFTEQIAVKMGDKELKATLDHNTGIIKCVNIAHAMRMLIQNPIGPPISVPGGPFVDIDNEEKGYAFEELPPEAWMGMRNK
jgi:Trypsin-like peptidase domain